MKSPKVGECSKKHALSSLQREIKNLVTQNNVDNLSVEELQEIIVSMVEQSIQDQNVCEFFNCASE